MLVRLLATWIPALLIGLSGLLTLTGSPKILETMTALGVACLHSHGVALDRCLVRDRSIFF